jgi:hypothetical protein
MAERQNYIVRNGVAQPFPIPDAPRPTISEMRQLLRGYDQQGTLLPNAAIITNDISKVDILRCGTLYADNIAGIVAETWTNPEPVYITLGGVEQGDVLTGLTAIDILERILYPYLAVSVSSFSMNYSQTVFEIGQTTPTASLFPSWSLQNISNATATGTNITYVYSGGSSGSVLSAANPASSGSVFVLPPGINSTTVGATLIYTISVAQEEGSAATRTQTISWRSKIYVGKNTSSDHTTITNHAQLSNGTSQFITSSSSPAASGISLTAGSGYVYIFVHTSLNPITSISIGTTDQTPAFPLVSSSYTFTNASGASSTYRVYKSTNQLNGDFTLNIT